MLILLSLPLRTVNASPASRLCGGGFAPSKTLLPGGNYRQRLITTSGVNDAAPNEIFIKDPSASN